MSSIFNRDKMDANIVECFQGYEDDNFKLTDPKTIDDCIEIFIYRFCGEFNHKYNKLKFPRLADRVCDYLRGMPFDFPIYYDEIIAFWAVLPSLAEGYKIVENHFPNLAELILSRMTDEQRDTIR